MIVVWQKEKNLNNKKKNRLFVASPNVCVSNLCLPQNEKIEFFLVLFVVHNVVSEIVRMHRMHRICCKCVPIVSFFCLVTKYDCLVDYCRIFLNAIER